MRRKGALGAVLIILMASFCTSAMGQETDIDRLRETGTTLCQIEADMQKYLGNEVTVDGVFVSGFEMGWFEDLVACDIQKRARISYTFDSNYRTITDRRTLRKFDKLAQKKLPSGQTVHRIKGRFAVRVEKYPNANPNENRYDFQIRILKVVLVED